MPRRRKRSQLATVFVLLSILAGKAVGLDCLDTAPLGSQTTNEQSGFEEASREDDVDPSILSGGVEGTVTDDRGVPISAARVVALGLGVEAEDGLELAVNEKLDVVDVRAGIFRQHGDDMVPLIVVDGRRRRFKAALDVSAKAPALIVDAHRKALSGGGDAPVDDALEIPADR